MSKYSPAIVISITMAWNRMRRPSRISWFSSGWISASAQAKASYTLCSSCVSRRVYMPTREEQNRDDLDLITLRVTDDKWDFEAQDSCVLVRADLAWYLLPQPKSTNPLAADEDPQITCVVLIVGLLRQ